MHIQKPQCYKARFLLTTNRDRGHITLMANSHWPARAPRNTARLKASSDKKARDDFLEDRWGIKGLGYMQSEDPGRMKGENPKYKLQGGWLHVPLPTLPLVCSRCSS